MSDLGLNSIVGRHHWLRHNLPWLAALALLLGMLRDEPELDFDPDERIG
jgi:hypothetical protein